MRIDLEYDERGRGFSDVMRDPELGPALWAAVAIMELDAFVERMVGAELEDQPALAGVVPIIERHPAFRRVLRSRPDADVERLKEAIAMVCRIAMENAGWRPTGRTGSLEPLAGCFLTAEHFAPAAEPAGRILGGGAPRPA